MKPADGKGVEAYIAGFPVAERKLLKSMRAALRKVVPGDADEKIAYGIPTFTWHGNLIHYAGFAKHVGLYPGGSVLTQFRHELARYKSGRGSVQFPLDEPLPIALIMRIAKSALAQRKAKLGAITARAKRRAPARPRS